MLDKKNLTLFADAVYDATPNWSNDAPADEWIDPVNTDTLVVCGYSLSGTAVDNFRVRIQLSVNGTDVFGYVPRHLDDIEGLLAVEALEFELPASAPFPTFEFLLRAGFYWRINLQRTGGDGTSQAEVKANLLEKG